MGSQDGIHKLTPKQQHIYVCVCVCVCMYVCSYIYIYIYMRESVPRQVDRESRGPQGERGLEFSRRKKGQIFFFLHIP